MSEPSTAEAVATRRQVMALGGGALSVLMIRPAGATPAAMEAAIRALAGNAPLRPGRVKLEVPPLVENGNSVALTVGVESPMTKDDFVRTIAIFNEKNPQPNVATFHLGPRAGRAVVSTRMRMADSQKIVAVAELADGTFWSDSADVIVTLAACLES
jgi:sulfur-oxidizing protein SoxY